MKNREFKLIGTRTINGKRVTIRESLTTRYYKIGKCNIAGTSVDDAISKYIACQAKRAN